MRGMTFSMPVFFQWSSLGFSMILLAGAAILLEAWMLLILILPFVAEARLFLPGKRVAQPGAPAALDADAQPAVVDALLGHQRADLASGALTDLNHKILGSEDLRIRI